MRDCDGCGRRFKGTNKLCSSCRAIERDCVGCGVRIRSHRRSCHKCRSIERKCGGCGKAMRGTNPLCTPCREVHSTSPTPNSLAALELLDYGVWPMEPFRSVAAPWRGVCRRCGAAVAPRLSDLRRGHGPCRSCASYGYDPSKPGYLYLIVARASRTLKVGITNNIDNRLAEHRRQGYDDDPLIVIAHADGAWIARQERSVLDRIRNDGYEPVPDAPADGHTETFPIEALTTVWLMFEVILGVKWDAERLDIGILG